MVEDLDKIGREIGPFKLKSYNSHMYKVFLLT